MLDRFMVPYYFFWPIAVISFIVVFFLPTNNNIEIFNKDNKANAIFNMEYNLLLSEKDNKTISEECNKYITNNKELQLISSFNLTIKIIVFVLFGLVFINIVLFLFNLYCCDEDDRFCQPCEYTFSFNEPEDPDFPFNCFWIFSIFSTICLGIIILSIFSIYFSSEFKSKMSLICGKEFDKDYYIKYWNTFTLFLIIIIILYLLEIIFSVYSICYGIIAFIKN